MNLESLQRSDLAGLSWAITSPLTVILIALWFATHWLRRKERFSGSRAADLAFFLLGTLTAYASFWTLFQFLGAFLVLSTDWSLSFLAFFGAFSLELLIALYQLEKSLTTPKRGLFLLSLRSVALVLLLLVLLQPVRSFLIDREINREVVILIDDSQSMHLPEQALPLSKQLDRAELFAVAGLEKRPKTHKFKKQIATLQQTLVAQISALESSPDQDALLKSSQEKLSTLLKNGGDTLTEATQALQKIATSAQLSADAKKRLDDLNAKLTGPATQALKASQAAAKTPKAAPFLQQVKSLSKTLSETLSALPALTDALDQSFFAQLNDSQGQAIDKAAAHTRIEVAQQILKTSDSSATEPGSSTFLDQLGKDYNLSFYRFARGIEKISDPQQLSKLASHESSATFRSLTDLSGALDHILENTSPESLAGVLLLSDGRHNAGTLPEDHLRRMAAQNSPLCAIPLGSQTGPVDSAILSLDAPESIYLGDRIVVKTQIKLDGLRGKKIKATLTNNDQMISEQVIEVKDVSSRQEIRFVHLPKEKGIYDYKLTLEPDPSEQFTDNNSWAFKVAITDERTNVLLVDSYPRWEFRYLRNLFYGRDKSVHLQYLLLNPDPIDGQAPLPAVHASASRKFGDAEATRLPQNEAEWRLFDVIILGDIPPAAIDSKTWQIIQKSVAQRGALLITVAGQRYMPHAFKNKHFRDLSPTTWQDANKASSPAKQSAYHLRLTQAGRSSQVTQLSASRAENARLWDNMPELHWRSFSTKIKEGAEVLAYAQPIAGSALLRADEKSSLNINPAEVEKALQALANRKQFEQDNALIISQQYALGKVLQLNFDRTWRLRYGVGDTYHHRFWGQVLRWGTGENLRSGSEYVRLGTDHLSYTPSDPIKVVVKLLDPQRRPITDGTIFAQLIDEQGNALHRQALTYRSGSNGIYESTLAALPDPGKYTIKIESKQVSRALSEDVESNLTELKTDLLVVSTRNPVELAELTADPDFLQYSTQLTNGSTSKLTDLSSLISHFGAPKETLTERRNITLWDKWPLLLIFIILFTTEWIFRRKAGLP
ncbi:MAG: gliding motility lipoprotein GldH [Verrucomicrobiales bacterium]|nr:gliding motility lipoprotein GldH [Verrucomicrobiales bacterium]